MKNIKIKDPKNLILNNTTYSEIEIVNKLISGSHFCYFYNNKYELLNLLVPYFLVGLRNNEFCIWVTSEDLSPEFAEDALREAQINFDYYLKKKQIKIIPYTKWYLEKDILNLEKVIERGTHYLNKAMIKGYSGLRVTGDSRWINKKDLETFIDYEIYISNIIGNYKMIAICTYPISKFNKFEILEIANSHQFALAKNGAIYKTIENVNLKQINKEKEILHSNKHHLLNLLNSIQANTELVLMKIKKTNSEYKYLKKIYASAKSAFEITKKLFRHK